MDLYTLIEMESQEILSCWAGELNHFDSVFGYSVLGHFFLYSKLENEYAVLHPMKKALRSYGAFKSVSEFEEQILKDENFVHYVLEPEHVRAVVEHVGALEAEQVYYPCPYPFIGGSDEPQTYLKGNVWVFADLVGQTHGI